MNMVQRLILKIVRVVALSLLSLLLYYILWSTIDEEFRKQIFHWPFEPMDMVFDYSSCLIFTVLALGLSKLVFKYIKWSRHPMLMIVTQIFLILVVNNITAGIVSNLLSSPYNDKDPIAYVESLYLTGILSTFVACIYAMTYYWKSYENVNKERNHFRLQALENQINPHFVFNNFSILADLIEVDPHKATEYLMKLSKVYRYTLSHFDHSLISIEEELDFLNQYLYLLNERFGNTITVSIHKNMKNLDGFIPPAALQMFVENAIKHNEHTATNPLLIEIDTDGQDIIVSNKKQRISSSVLSANVGNDNISERYGILSKQSIKINETNDNFTVRLPIIHKKGT